MKTRKSLIWTGAVILAVAATGANAQTVMLNGQPLTTEVAPVTENGRTLVPMRDIFEALGANVTYDGLTRGITATRGATVVRMQLGNREALINGQRMMLEAPAQTRFNRTLVPLRFVSEAMGAQVSYDNATRIVAITSTQQVAANPPTDVPDAGGEAVAGVRTISVPEGAVVPVTLDAAISSADAKQGDRFTATVATQQTGDSEFPAGTKVEGVVTEAQAQQDNEPGVLNLAFRTAILPDGTRYDLQGQLISLDNDAVSDDGRGRVTAKARDNNDNNDSFKVIGVGAGVGYVVGRLLKKNGIVAAIIGAAGGFLYDRSKNKNERVAEAALPEGTRLGMRLERGVTYADTGNYGQQRTAFTGG